jgi:hypothetical protein
VRKKVIASLNCFKKIGAFTSWRERIMDYLREGKRRVKVSSSQQM